MPSLLIRIDTLARVSLYLVSQPSREFASLVAPLLTPEAIPNTALVVLLDWSHPHLWLRQIWTWIQVFQKVVEQLSTDSRDQMAEVMSAWKERGRGGASTNLDGTPSATAGGDGDSSLPLGPGEWEEPLGLPLCVVCQNVSQIHSPRCGPWLNFQRRKRWSFWKRVRVGKSPISIPSYNTSEPCCYVVSLIGKYFERPALIVLRWCLSCLHFTKFTLTTSYPYPFYTRNYFSTKTTTA